MDIFDPQAVGRLDSQDRDIHDSHDIDILDPNINIFYQNIKSTCHYLTDETFEPVLDKHAPPSLRNVITHNSSPWFEPIRDELVIAKRGNGGAQS